MGIRGTKSAASKAVVVEVSFDRRAEPPPDLTEQQAAIWRETIATEPVDQFATAAQRAMLKGYCRQMAEAERVSTIIDQYQAAWLKNAEGAKRYKELIQTRDISYRGAVAAARALRITNQSRYTPGAAATAAKRSLAKMPWDDDFDEKAD